MALNSRNDKGFPPNQTRARQKRLAKETARLLSCRQIIGLALLIRGAVAHDVANLSPHFIFLLRYCTLEAIIWHATMMTTMIVHDPRNDLGERTPPSHRTPVRC